MQRMSRRRIAAFRWARGRRNPDLEKDERRTPETDL
jgi:hypothetical protein